MPALLSDPDATMAMAVPMDWSVAEPAVGILVSSMPAIRAVRFLWMKRGDNSYASASGAVKSTLKSRNDNSIHLYKLKAEGAKGATSDAESGGHMENNDSEEQLVIQGYGMPGLGQISKTTELEVTYDAK